MPVLRCKPGLSELGALEGFEVTLLPSAPCSSLLLQPFVLPFSWAWQFLGLAQPGPCRLNPAGFVVHPSSKETAWGCAPWAGTAGDIPALGQPNKGEMKSPKTGLNHQDFLCFHVCVLLQFQPCCFPKEITWMWKTEQCWDPLLSVPMGSSEQN